LHADQRGLCLVVAGGSIGADESTINVHNQVAMMQVVVLSLVEQRDFCQVARVNSCCAMYGARSTSTCV
jgi:hypothetical protein